MIIVLVLAGIASVNTYAIVRPEPRTIQDLSAELKEETSRIVDYGVYNSNTENLNIILDNFTDTEFAPYFLQKTGETGIVFLYGNKTDLRAVEYKEQLTGTISATIGTVGAVWVPATTFAQRATVVAEDPLKVNITGREFEFDLQDNEMFYFVIVQEEEGETYVERN